MAVPNIFTNGTVADADEVNANFNYLDTFSSGLVPVGTVLPWLKTFQQLDTGTPTSVSAGKLIDTGATFSSILIAGQHVTFSPTYSNTTTVSISTPTETSGTYYLKKTITLGDSSNGYIIASVDNEIYAGSVTTADSCNCKMRFYYTDASNEYSSVQSVTATETWTAKTYTNPQAAKYVWKIEVYLMANKTAGNEVNAQEKNTAMTITSPRITSITTVDSATQLTLSVDIITDVFMTYIIYATPSFEDNFVECNGQTLSDEDSVYDGATIPNLNNSYYLKGSTTSGTASTFGGSGTTYANYTVVYIMRVK